MIAAMAQWEREEIGERIKASVAIRAKLGKQLSGSSPYGFQWKDKKLVQKAQEAPIRKLVYESFAEHRRKGFVARKLNDAGYRTRGGFKWSDMTVGRVLRCPSAKGVYYLNRTRQMGDWKWEDKPESEWGVLEIEPIVSEALWSQCNQILADQTKNKKPPGKKPVQLFTSPCYCHCGQRMYVMANSPKYACQKCHNKIPVVDLEAIFHDELKAFFASPDLIAKHLEEANQNLNKKEALLQTHENDIRKVREEMTLTHRLYVEGGITSQGFAEFYKPAEERLNQLVAELPKLQAEIDHSQINSI